MTHYVWPSTSFSRALPISLWLCLATATAMPCTAPRWPRPPKVRTVTTVVRVFLRSLKKNCGCPLEHIARTEVKINGKKLSRKTDERLRIRQQDSKLLEGWQYKIKSNVSLTYTDGSRLPNWGATLPSPPLSFPSFFLLFLFPSPFPLPPLRSSPP